MSPDLTSPWMWLALLGGLLLGAAVLVPWALALARRAAADAGAARESEVTALRERLDERQTRQTQLEKELADLRLRCDRQEVGLRNLLGERSELKGRVEQLAPLEARLRQREAELAALHQERAELLAQRAELNTRLQADSAHAEERLALLERVREEFADHFKALAGEVLEDKSRRLIQENAAQLGGLLSPVREQLKGFQEAVQQAYVQEAKERSLLKHEIDALRQLNQQLNAEAVNLTRALRGDNRTQGAWGELVLERLLESAALVEGREYTRQAALSAEDGGRPRPDVIVHLPQARDLVIDAKVSLTAYERAVAATADNEREQQFVLHLSSLRKHVESLSRREYSELLAGRSLDFVLLFVPVESALMEAVRRDSGLYEYALSRNIAIVSPSSLLATLRAVSHLWKQEQRSRHAQEIARQAGAMYDKFVGFCEDLLALREAIDKARQRADQAFGKLREGRGNLIRRAEQLRELGARSSKNLPEGLLALDSPQDEDSETGAS